MNVVLMFSLMLFSTFTYAIGNLEERLFNDLNSSIVALGERITFCKESSLGNKPDTDTLIFAKQRLNELTPVLAHLNYMAIENCSFNEKKELAYNLLIAKNNSKRHSTLELVKATEIMTFSFNTESQIKFDNLNSETKKFLINSEFFSKPFDVLGFYEIVVDM